MPTRSPGPSWGFEAAVDLIHSDDGDLIDLSSPTLSSRSSSLVNGPKDTGDDTAVTSPAISLGSFQALWERLGITIDEPEPDVKHADTKATESTAPDDKPLSQPIEPHNPVSQALERSEVKSELLELDQTEPMDPYAGMTKKQRSRARQAASQLRQAEAARREGYDKQEQERVDMEAKLNAEADKALSAPKKDKKDQKEAKDQKEVVTIMSQNPQSTRSRSNVGAKIRPASPTPVVPPVKKEATTPAHVPPPALSKKNEVTEAIDRIPQEHRNGLTPYNLRTMARPTLKPATLPQVPGTPPVHYSLQALQASMNPTQALHASLYTQYQTPPGMAPQPVQYISNYGTPTPHHGNSPYFTPAPGPSATQFIPSSVPVISTKKTKKDITLSREDRNFEFLKKLMSKFPEDKKWLVSPMRLSVDSTTPAGIHVFVDASNILIGFRNTLRETGKDPNLHMSFDCLALLLERRRPVAKRVYAGSTRASGVHESHDKFNELAGAVGYQRDIYEQVLKVREPTERQLFFRDVERLGYAKAVQMRAEGSGSDSETGPAPNTPPPPPKWVEQGVDESLHLKMCQSIIDTDVPSTMVLATGDGAAAEYSDGFLAHVERALRKGWNVELVSWKQQTNGGYRKRHFKQKWANQFRIIELDDFVEYMIDA